MHVHSPTSSPLSSSHDFHLDHADSTRSGWLLGAIGTIILVGSLLAACLGSLSFAVGVGGMVCGTGYILFGIYFSKSSQKNLLQESNTPPIAALPPLLDRELEGLLLVHVNIVNKDLLSIQLVALIDRQERVVGGFLQLIQERFEELDEAIQLRERLKRLDYPTSLTVKDLLAAWPNSSLRYELMMDDELVNLKACDISQPGSFFVGTIPNRITELSSNYPDAIPEICQMLILRNNINFYLTKAVRVQSKNLSTEIANLLGDAVIGYKYNNAIHYVSSGTYWLKMGGSLSQNMRILTDRLMKLDPEKLRLIFQDSKKIIEPAFGVIKRTNMVSAATSDLYNVGYQFASDMRHLGFYMGLPNPMDYVPQLVKNGVTGCVKGLSWAIWAINGLSAALLPALVETLMDYSSLNDSIKATLDRGLPQIFSKINQFLNHIDSTEISRIFVKFLANWIHLESTAESCIKERLGNDRFNALNPNQKLILTLTHFQEHSIAIPGISEESIQTLNENTIEERLNGFFEEYINDKFYPSLFSMIIPEYIDALSHFFGVMLDMPNQNAFKPSFVYILSETFLKTFSDPEQFELFILQVLGGNAPAEEGDFRFQDEQAVQHCLDSWLMFNHAHPLAEDALRELETCELIQLEASEVHHEHGSRFRAATLKSSIRQTISDGFMTLSQKPGWQIAHLFFLERLRLYLDKVHQIIEAKQNGEEIQDLQAELHESLNVEKIETTSILNHLISPREGALKSKIISQVYSFIVHNFKKVRKNIYTNSYIDMKNLLYGHGKYPIYLDTKIVLNKLYTVFRATSKQEKKVVEIFLKGYLDRVISMLENKHDSQNIAEAIDRHIERISGFSDHRLLKEIKNTRFQAYDHPE